MNICLAKERRKKKTKKNREPILEKKNYTNVFFFFFFPSSSSMYEMAPLSRRILRTNLSDVKNSCKHPHTNLILTSNGTREVKQFQDHPMTKT